MKLSAWQKLALVSASAAMAAVTSTANASAFQLYEESASGTGDYHAGYAAEADDASTEFYNPAGMVRIKHLEVSSGAVLIPLNAKFNGAIHETIGGTPLPALSTNGWVDGSTTSLIPNLHVVYPFKKRWAFGFGVTVPFGLASSYPWDSNASYGATVTRIAAFNFNPSLAYAVTKKMSLAAGLDVVYGTATYDQNVGLPGSSGVFTNSLSGTAVGWNAGMLYQFTPKTRVGLTYRSHVKLNASGTSTLTDITTSGDPQSSKVKAGLDLPGYATLSVFSNVRPKWDLMATAMWTNWNRFSTLSLRNTALQFSVITLPADIIVHEDYSNTWNFAVGAHYHINQRFLLKMGGGYDMTPTKTGYRDSRLPDASRIAIAAGLQAGITKWLVADFGWAHLFAKDSVIDSTQSGSPVTSTGKAKMSANVIGLQFTAKLDELQL